MGGQRAGRLHQLEEDASSVQREGEQEVRPGLEKSKVANQGLQDESSSSLRVLNKNVIPTVFTASQP